MFFCVLSSVLFMYLVNLQISRSSSYNAKLHSCSPDTLDISFLTFSPCKLMIWKMIFSLFFPLSRGTKNSNRANSLELLLTFLGGESVNVRRACVCVYVCAHEYARTT